MIKTSNYLIEFNLLDFYALQHVAAVEFAILTDSQIFQMHKFQFSSKILHINSIIVWNQHLKQPLGIKQFCFTKKMCNKN